MLGKFKLSDSSIELLKDTNTGIARRMSVLSKFNPEVERIILDLKNTLFQIFEEAYTGGRITENFRENNGVLEAYTDFLSKAVVLSYYGLLDNDKNLAKLRQRAEERGEDKRIDFMFGFQGLFNVVAIAVGIIEDRDVPTDKVAGRSMSNLLSSIRQIEVGEYLDGGYADMDIELIVLLGNHSESELNDFVMSYIKSDNTLNSCYMDTLAQVMTVYKYLFQDSFGLRPYVGVLSFQAPYIQVIDDTMHLNTISTARSSFEIISSVLKESFKVREMMDRQFDVKTIIRGSDSTPYYYPVKMLEYAMGRELTYELSENVYRNFANNKSWEDYAEGYVEPNMKKYFMDCIYYSLERHFEFGGVRGSDTDDFFSSEEFSAILEEYGENAVKVYLSGAQMMSGVMNDLEKLKRSLCTAVAVVRYNNLGNKVNAVTIRIVNTVGNALSVTTGDLYGSFTTNRNTKFDSGDIISKGKCIGGDASKPLPYDIIEFRHDFDSAVATAEPLFGYKAVEMFRSRGIKLGWDKILLGEDIKGTPVFASLGDVDDFPMQSKVVHNMMAGSRSGKGVMTMNMLASGIASGKPIFYIDRKPDMAVLFYELSQGNMFVVNGGQYEGKNDINKYFSDEGVAVSGWAEAYERMPPYLKKAFFSAKTYSGNFGDYVYFRAVMFMLGILMARVELAGDAAIFNNLGGERGIVVVVDEFKNWQVQFESVFFSPDGLFCNQHRLSKSRRAAYRKAQHDIEQRNAKISSYAGDEKNADKIVKLEGEIKDHESVMSESVSELDVYCTTLMDKYGESVKHINSKLSAGFKDSEGLRSDIFVIGQHIETDEYNGASESSGTYQRRDSGEFNVNSDTKGRSLMRGIFNMFQHDWFMGYNADGQHEKHYMGADKEGSEANKWISKQKYWAYCPDASMKRLRDAAPADTRYFKPYLVLNKHFEDNPDQPMMFSVRNAKGQTEQIVHPDYAFVAQCRSRVNNAVPGANLWEQIRIKHLKSEAMAEDAENGIDRHYGELNEGIGFQGLASQTKMCNGMGNFIPTRDLDASRAIADYVAQCMGYSGYMDLLFDFSPKGLFSTQDVCNALANPKAYQTSLNERLPLFVEYNFLNEADSKTVHVADIKNSTFYNESLYDNLGKPDEKNIKSGGTGQSSVNRDDLNHGKRHMGSVNQGNVNRGGAGQSSVNQGKRPMGSAAFGMSGWDDESENDTQMSQDDLIALCTKVTTNVFLTFYKRYGNNVKDEKVHNYITEYARSVIYEYIHG